MMRAKRRRAQTDWRPQIKKAERELAKSADEINRGLTEPGALPPTPIEATEAGEQ